MNLKLIKNFIKISILSITSYLIYKIAFIINIKMHENAVIEELNTIVYRMHINKYNLETVKKPNYKTNTNIQNILNFQYVNNNILKMNTFKNQPTLDQKWNINIFKYTQLNELNGVLSKYFTLKNKFNWNIKYNVTQKISEHSVYVKNFNYSVNTKPNDNNFDQIFCNNSVNKFKQNMEIKHYLFWTLILFFISNTLVSVFNLYITFNGVYLLTIVNLTALYITLLLGAWNITAKASVYFLEIKIYSLYISSSINSIVISWDYLSYAFSILVITICLSAVMYTRIYLYADANASDFLIKLNWFAFCMLLLVMSKNFILIYFFWEFIGITSAWLINFNSQRLDTFKSSIKAFFFNKISDLFLISALLIGYWTFNSAIITDWELSLVSVDVFDTKENKKNIIIMSWLFVLAASIKSAQIGAHIWLPDSMDAPVPASALIHSATLVSAGVYLLLRFFNIIQYANLLPLVALLGSITAFYGGIVASMQTDLKKALAYSTISHCGFLFVMVSIGSLNGALLYLFLHGIFKALSFICAGEAIRTHGGQQDINRMGSFFYVSPSLSTQLFVAMSNLCGLPFFLGYIFKNAFQTQLLTNSFLPYLIESFCLLGMLCSLYYFIKVFYIVCFSFKKYNYKEFKIIKKNSKHIFLGANKTPPILTIIFWTLYITSMLLVYKLFEQELTITTYTANNYLNKNLEFNLFNDSVIKNKFKINFFFFFYILFLTSIYIINSIYIVRNIKNTKQISKINTLLLIMSITYIFIV